MTNTSANVATEVEMEHIVCLALHASGRYVINALAIEQAILAMQKASRMPSATTFTTILNPDRIGLAKAGENDSPVFSVRLANKSLNYQVRYLPQEEHMARFEMEGEFGNEVPCQTKKVEFEEYAEWIHTQTKGRWSVRIEIEIALNLKINTENTIYSFESKEDATLFKLFRT